jgi:hypothetical protein
MKKAVFILLAIVVCLGILLVLAYKNNDELGLKWKIAEANVKSYSNLYDLGNKRAAALQLTVDQLGYFKDSVLQELDATRKELKIKDKNLKALQMVSSSFSKADTIYHTDTLFRQPSLQMDTLIGDEWYTLRLGLKYPSMVAVKPEFKSKKHIVVSSKKETVNPPKKFFLFRWFQKKHVVVHIDVVERNPYVNDETTRYVEIIK